MILLRSPVLLTQEQRASKSKNKRPLLSALHKNESGEGEKCGDVEGKESWTIHVAFGNKDFKSNLEVKLSLKHELACIVEWIEARRGDRDHGVPFSAGQLYAESGYRDWVKARKEEIIHRKKRRTAGAEDQNMESKRHYELMASEDDGEERMGHFEDEYDIEGDLEEGDEEFAGGFSEVEQLLSVLVFNGYLRLLRHQPTQQ